MSFIVVIIILLLLLLVDNFEYFLCSFCLQQRRNRGILRVVIYKTKIDNKTKTKPQNEHNLAAIS